MLLKLMLAMCALFGWGEAAAQQADPAGRWALRSGDRTLMILELSPVARTTAQWEGSIRRPKGFQLSPGAVSVLLIGEPQLISQKVRAEQAGTGVILRSTDAKGEVTQWRFMVAGERAQMELADLPPGVGPGPLRLARAGGQEQVSTDLEAGSRFVLGADLPSNAEMKSIFEADQADRRSGPNIDWAVVGPRDVARRARTAALLDAGALQSADDFWHAAFIFQHGSKPDDYLLAHSLAVIAAARGRPDATWIAAATLDRYLQHIGQKQIYGTQYMTRRGEATTQEPYDRRLVSDALRAALGVPPQAEQERRRAETERTMREAEAAAPRS